MGSGSSILLPDEITPSFAALCTASTNSCPLLSSFPGESVSKKTFICRIVSENESIIPQIIRPFASENVLTVDGFVLLCTAYNLIDLELFNLPNAIELFQKAETNGCITIDTFQVRVLDSIASAKGMDPDELKFNLLCNHSIKSNKSLTQQKLKPFSKMGVRLSVIYDFIDLCGGRDILEGLTTSQICNNFLKPLTYTRQCSYCEMLVEDNNPNVLEAQLMEAYDLILECLEGYKVLYGENDKDTWVAMGDLALICIQLDDYEKAEELYVTVVDLSKRNLDESHPHVLVYTGKYDIAEQLYTEIIGLSLLTLGEKHPQRIAYMANLAEIYEIQENFESAEPLYKTCLELETAELGEDHPNTLKSMNNLASLYSRVIILSSNTLGEYHPNTLLSINNLAVLYKTQGRFDEAERLYLQCANLSRDKLGGCHPSTLLFTCNLAGLYFSQGKSEEALSMFLDCYDKSRIRLGENHPDSMSTLGWIVHIYMQQGNYVEVESIYTHTYEELKSSYGEEYPDTIAAKEALEDIREALATSSAAFAVAADTDDGI
eukprot:gene7086-14418_t